MQGFPVPMLRVVRFKCQTNVFYAFGKRGEYKALIVALFRWQHIMRFVFKDVADEITPARTTLDIFLQQVRVELLPKRASKDCNQKRFVNSRRSTVAPQLSV